MVCFSFPPVNVPHAIPADSSSLFIRSKAVCIHTSSIIPAPKTRVGALHSAFCRPHHLASLDHVVRLNTTAKKDDELPNRNANCYSRRYLGCAISACDRSPETDESSSQFAYILGTFIAAISGGYILSISSLAFYWLGRLAEAPAWICSLAALLSGALIDTLVANSFITIPFLGRPSLLPYILFTATFVTSAVFDFDAVFGTITPGTSAAKLHQKSDSPKIDMSSENMDMDKQVGDEMSKWDRRMIRKQTETGEGTEEQVPGSD